MQIVGEFSAEYKKQFEEYTSLLIYLAGKSKTTYTQRWEKVNFLTTEYIKQTGNRPDHKQVDRLSDLLLYDDLNDTNPHKIQHCEYPILSASQLDRRRFGGRSEGSNMYGETSLEEAEYVAADGRDYRYPNRRKRTIHELIFVDESAKIRNKERADQYWVDTRPSRIRRKASAPFTNCVGTADKWRAFAASGREEVVREAEKPALIAA